MPDTGVIVTGLVGLAGIAGTLLSARITARSDMAGLRLSITAEEQRAQLAEKRRIYAGFHTSIEKLIFDYSLMHERLGTAGPDERQELRRVPDAATVAMFNGLSEIMLIAPKPMGRQAQQLANLLLTYANTAMSDDPDAIETGLDEIAKQRLALYETMRADLGTGQTPAG